MLHRRCSPWPLPRSPIVTSILCFSMSVQLLLALIQITSLFRHVSKIFPFPASSIPLWSCWFVFFAVLVSPLSNLSCLFPAPLASIACVVPHTNSSHWCHWQPHYCFPNNSATFSVGSFQPPFGHFTNCASPAAETEALKRNQYCTVWFKIPTRVFLTWNCEKWSCICPLFAGD